MALNPVPVRRARSRRWALAGLGLLVIALHAAFGMWWSTQLQALGTSTEGPKRLKADFVAELRPAQPPSPAPRPAPAPAPRRAAAAAPAAAASAAPAAAASATSAPEAMAEAASVAASAPQAVALLPDAAGATGADIVPAQAASSPEVVAGPSAAPAEPAGLPPMAERPGESASGSASTAPAALAAAAASTSDPAAAAASAPVADAMAFEWPRSTRLSYRLSGHFRGPVDGQASVEWLRDGSRYQVHVEVSVGPSFAPLLSRRMSSDGEIGADGLSPRRYEEETRAALRAPRRLVVLFGEGFVRLPGGAEHPRPAGVQDSASQFVQLTWLFTTQPHRLRSGESIPLMLALPRRIDTWVYDVLMQETLATGAGPVEAVHVRPRRPERPGSELTAEMWVAPSLQYLPVRIVIRQDAETFVDLLLERLPRQTAEGR